MNKVSLDFSTNQYSDAELSVKAQTISVDLDGNAFFPTLAANVTIIKGLNTTFDDYLAKMADGNKRLTVEKNNARLDLVEAICEAGRLVQNVSKGDEVMILSSGFDICRKPTFADILDQPADMKVKPGKLGGTLDVSWKSVDHAYGYVSRFTIAPVTANSVYGTATSSKCKVTLDGLIPGQQYAVQTAGIGSDTRRVWSTVVFSYVL
jgi:hypothetical protein